MTELIDAAAAASRLGVGRPTLYAYVSRGLVRAEPDPADPRRSLYRAEDVAALVARKARGRKPDVIARSALDGGLPVMDSSVTLIRDGRFWYRGRDAIELAAEATLEAVARLLWEATDGSDPFAIPAERPEAWPPLREALARVPPMARAMALLPLADPQGFGSWALGPAAMARAGAALVRRLAAAFLGTAPATDPIHLQLARAWGLDDGDADRLRRALVLSADHELNASTFVVRGVISTGASLTAAVVAGLAALSGPRHGGATARVEGLLDEVALDGDAARVVAARLQRGEPIPGFSHPLYPDGDPRGTALVALLPEDGVHRAVVDAVTAATGQGPTIDFGGVALCRSMGLAAGSAFTLFAVGRSVGWVAHALEQRRDPRLIRPRAFYTGPEPGGD